MLLLKRGVWDFRRLRKAGSEEVGNSDDWLPFSPFLDFWSMVKVLARMNRKSRLAPLSSQVPGA